MKTWWLGLNSREQRLIGSLGAVVIVFILYSVIWQPLTNNIANTEKKVKRQQELLVWVKQEVSRFKASGQHNTNAKATGSLASIVNNAASRSGIAITRIQPQGEDLQVWIDNIAFNTLLEWLAQLSQQQGLAIKNIDLDATEVNGEVRVRRLQLGKN